MPERLLRQFKKLDQICPSAEWKENTRNFLFNRVKQDTLDYQRSIMDKTAIFSFVWIRRLIPSPVKIVTVLTIIGLMGLTNIAAQAENKPNRLLYDVKLMFEKIPLMIAVTNKTEASVYMKHATKRLEEARQVSESTTISQQDKEEFVNTLVKSAKQNAGAAKDSLEIVTENKQNPVAMAQLAKEITKNAQETIKALDQVAEQAPINDVTKNVAEARLVIEETQAASLEVLMDKTEKREVPLNIVSKDEIKDILSNSIAIQEKKINDINQKISQLNQQPKPDKNSTTKIEIKRPEIEAVKKTSEEAKGLLEQAKLLLKEGQLQAALEKVKESTEIIKKSMDAVVKIEQISAGKNIKENEQTSGNTTTPKVIGRPVGNSTSTLETTPPVINLDKLKIKIDPSASQTDGQGDESLLNN